MSHDDDPPSTHCTFIVSTVEKEPFTFAVPGDRLELVEVRGEHATGRMLVARIVKVQHLGPRLHLRDLRANARLRYDPRSSAHVAAQGDVMEELVKLVSQKTGLSAEHARLAVDTVVGFLKAKLPPALASQVDGVLSGGGVSGALDALGGAGLGGLGDLFGKK